MDNRFAEPLTQLKEIANHSSSTKAAVTQALLQGCLDTLHIQRASLWLFADDDLMSCQMLLDQQHGITEEALMIDRWSFPNYFSALDSNEVVLAADAFHHPATSELCEHFLRPMNIRSLLDVPIKQHNGIAGIICCEQTNTIKHWSLDEVEFVKAVCKLFGSSII